MTAATLPPTGPLAWIDMLGQVARHYRMPFAEQRARLTALWQGDDGEETRVRAIARASGLSVRFVAPGAIKLTSWRLPVIACLTDGELALVTGIDAEGQVEFIVAGEDGQAVQRPLAMLVEQTRLFVVPRPARSAADVRVDSYIRPFEEHWLRSLLLQDARSYGNVAVASVVTNCLGLAGVLFSMQVYDRVVPAQSMPTLYILFLGVLLATGFDFVLRRLRVGITDILGKRADLRLSDRVFGHALRVRNRARPTSTGTFIAQLRDLDQVRDMLTSTTVAAVADLPFFLLFLVILAFIGGVLALVPVVALIALLLPSLLAQRRLRAYATESMRETSLRNALLVEAVQGIEDIKALQAEERFQRQWNHCNAVAGEAQLRLRGLTASLSTWAQSVQNAVYATVIFVGAPMVIAGDITTGALVATSMLASRMMAPMGQVSHLLGRYQHAKVAANSLDQIMALPVDNPDAEHRIPLPSARGGFTLRTAVFSYADPQSPPALTVPRLEIAGGEKIAVLGRNGAGKSTLLQGLSGMLQPVSGEVLLDDLALHQIDPADVRREVALLTQNSRLFHGTLRENLTMGAPVAGNDAILAALEMVGAVDFVRRLRDGLEHVVLEGGRGLSGGQQQALLLARLLIRQPQVMLLDEPTAAMDEASERQFIARFQEWSRDRTVVVATHRMRVLDWVDRVIVIDNGLILLDQPKAQALATLQGAARSQAA
ncbi:type I secretion system permease/ATPase [Sphingomonas sp. SORGH_AS_0879]|uniref:type I secretion system permease/ATPase n=1 Tax=Sphingomonas sp. SORGH_AS_0879 TaxID=3041790 RepID=UPI00277E23B8|nr:type I secretion system permease/ATPase [Sphingomonas sp. SORGH_AS_0879]MDQ1231901.1 ATP-binding cassette subfamily C protein LapB [Sphingomonas sp. SORGH_AS_0879]